MLPSTRPAEALVPVRPDRVVASAVLAFVQAGVVFLTALYVLQRAWMVHVEAAGSPWWPPASVTLAVVALLELLSVVLLAVAGFRAHDPRTPAAWRLAIAAHGSQLVFCVAWVGWIGSVWDASSVIDGGLGQRAWAITAILFALLPMAGLVLLLTRPARQWLTEQPAG